MPITVTFQLTKTDLIRFWYLAVLSRPGVLAFWIVLFAVVPWAAALMLLQGPSAGRFLATLLFLLPFAVFVISSLLTLWVARRARMPDGPYTYEFLENGIHLAAPGFDGNVDWTAVTRCYGSGLGILFSSGKRPCLTVPGRCLSQAARAGLRQMIVTRGIQLAGPWKREKPQQDRSVDS